MLALPVLDGLEVGPLHPGRTPLALITVGGEMLRASLASAEEPALNIWHPQVFNADSRGKADLALVLSESTCLWVARLEAAVLAKLQAAPEAYLPGATAENIKLLFHSALKEKNAGPAMRVRVFLGTSTKGPPTTRWWSPDKKQIQMPENLAGAHLVPIVRPSHVWVNTTAIGVLWECTDVLVVTTRPVPQCPF